MLAQKSPEMKAPVEKLLEINQDPKARILYEAREKQRRDIASRERRARQEGRQEGRQEERKEVAKNLLKMNMPIEHIINATKLSHKEIEELSKKNQ